jgi:hypothetical protein
MLGSDVRVGEKLEIGGKKHERPRRGVSGVLAGVSESDTRTVLSAGYPVVDDSVLLSH